MKRFLLTLGLIVAVSSFVPTQAGVNVNVNIGLQPAWGPTGYDYAGYYYFPDIDIYYNVNAAQFVYWDGRVWVSARYLPYRYRNYDLYPMYKVVINDRDPWRHNDRYRRQYAHYRGYRNQPIIMNSHDRRYRDSRNNRVNWVDSNRRPSNGRYSSNDRHSGNSSGRYSNQDHRQNNHYNNDGRSNSNQNDRYSSGRNTTPRSSASRDNRDNSVSRSTSNRDSQQTTPSSNRRSSNTSSRSDRSVASANKSSRSSRSNKTTEGRSSNRPSNNSERVSR